MGKSLSDGRGVARKEKEAATWFLRAAKQGHVSAQYNLAVAYLSGRGVAQNDMEAATWFRRAAERGHLKAQHNLATMFVTCRGVMKNQEEAFGWYLRAAEKGEAVSQLSVGTTLKDGEGSLSHVEDALLAGCLAAMCSQHQSLGQLIHARFHLAIHAHGSPPFALCLAGPFVCGVQSHLAAQSTDG